MYVTGDPAVAALAQASGVDWVFVDLELLGKHDRQGHLDTVISGHTVADVRAVRAVLDRSRLLVRINPINPRTHHEVEEVIAAGADIVMLPFFDGPDEVEQFVRLVAGRADVCLLVETPRAAERIDEIVAVPGVDYVHIGLNDLHLALGMSFMFELVVDGTVERLCESVGRAAIPYGFGGVGRIGTGDLRAEDVLAEHYRMGSSMVILSRTFCDVSKLGDTDDVAALFDLEVRRIREHEARLAEADQSFFDRSRRDAADAVLRISEQKRAIAAQAR